MKNVEVSENSPLSTGLGEGLSNGLVVGPKGNGSSLSIADTVQCSSTPLPQLESRILGVGRLMEFPPVKWTRRRPLEGI